MIELKLQLAPKTEDKLREYVRKTFNKTLEQKLRDVLIQWIGKAIKHFSRKKREMKREEMKEKA